MNFEQPPQPKPTEDALPEKGKITEPLDIALWHKGKTIPTFPKNKNHKHARRTIESSIHEIESILESQDAALWHKGKTIPAFPPKGHMKRARKTIEFSPHETESVLEFREVEYKNELDGGTNESFFVKLKDDGSGVFKPRSGEEYGLRTLIPAGTYFLREYAAYIIDKTIGLGMIPPTVIREVDGEEGSVQEFIPDAKTQWEAEFSAKELDALSDEIRKLKILDYILWNSDRHNGNFLIKGDKVYAIDNSLSFAHEGTYGFDELYTGKVPDDTKEKVEQFANNLDKQAELRESLKQFLPLFEVESCIRRIQFIGTVLQKNDGHVPADALLQYAYNG